MTSVDTTSLTPALPVEPMAAEVRRRMLRHLGLLPDGGFDQSMIDAVLALPLSATDRRLIIAEVEAVGVAAAAQADSLHVPTVVVTASPAATVTVPPATQPVVSVVIVGYGTGTIVVDTIASLAAAATAAHMAIEVIVVDNPHPTQPDRTMTALRLFTHGVRVVRAVANAGFGGGCELGAIYARADVLAFVNPDIVVPRGWLEPLMEALGDESVSIVAPVLVNADGSIQEVGQTLESSGLTKPRRSVPATPRLIAVAYASAACWLMRSAEHERLGGFDPAYHPAYFEDADLALRASALGGSCVVHSGVRVVHHGGCGTPDETSSVDGQRGVFVDRWASVLS